MGGGGCKGVGMDVSIASITHYVNLFQFALFLNLHGGFSLR